MSSTTNGPKRKYELDASSAAKHDTQSGTISSCVSNILDIPKEILIKIILCLNARERVALGHSCKQFNNIEFEDEEMLRNLDFSKDGRFTLASEVQQYFETENACNRILGVNMRNTGCIKPGRMLNDSIGKARNLVNINIHGIGFEDIWQLGSFLNPLLHVERLSFDWSETRDSCILMCCKFLQQPFSKLKYLSVDMKAMDCVKVFIPAVRLCQELRKLHLVVREYSQTSYSDNWSGDPKELRDLDDLQYCGPLAMQMKERFGTLLPNPEKWVDFQMQSSSDPQGFYLALVDVCKELADSKWMERIPNITPENRFNLGWALLPELLLKEALSITHDVPEEFCCLSTVMDKQRCLLKIDDAKSLLKNPRSQISYLYMNHPIHLGCHVHLVASAFANLTELQLAAVTRDQESFPMDSHFQRQLKRRGDEIPEKFNEPLNMDSSFKMLVENIPRLRHFTLGSCDTYVNWDLDELHLIPKWKFLQTLRLLDIPIEDGEFLIEIEKQCENLQNLELIRLGSSNACCYQKELLQMLTNCRNLRDFSMEVADFEEISEVFALLANNVHLTRVHMKTPCNANVKHSLAMSIQRLLRQCLKLTTFVGEFSCLWQTMFSRHVSPLEIRWKDELSRPHLQVKTFWGTTVVGTVSEDSPYPNPFPKMWTTN